MTTKAKILSAVTAAGLGVATLAALEMPSLRIAYRGAIVLAVVCLLVWMVLGAIGIDIKRSSRNQDKE
jgi:ABC-type proline/glycine betaine transport system permease subunit